MNTDSSELSDDEVGIYEKKILLFRKNIKELSFTQDRDTEVESIYYKFLNNQQFYFYFTLLGTQDFIVSWNNRSDESQILSTSPLFSSHKSYENKSDIDTEIKDAIHIVIFLLMISIIIILK
jgi:hypothetical protein